MALPLLLALGTGKSFEANDCEVKTAAILDLSQIDFDLKCVPKKKESEVQIANRTPIHRPGG